MTTNYEMYKNTIRRYIPNAEEFLGWLDITNAETSPESDKYNLNVEGGWIKHQLNVLNRLSKEVRVEFGDELEKHFSYETLVKVALLHDLCKIDLYETYIRNVKEDGRWVEKQEYRIKENGGFFYGDFGDNSVRIAEKFFKLTDEEAIAIKYAYGVDETKKIMLHKVNQKYPLAMFLQIAITKATDMDEVVNEQID